MGWIGSCRVEGERIMLVDMAMDQRVPSHPAAREALPTHFESEVALEEYLTRPSPALIDSIRGCASPLVVLGAGGKMGPSLAVLARRAAEAGGHRLEVMAISRYSDARARDWLEAREVRTLAADLLDSGAVSRLPDSYNVVYLVGLKFGTSRNPSVTWAMNTLVPAAVMERYSRARIVALSTGNVYPFVEPSSGGAVESAALTPLGEYANAAVARERIFEYGSRRRGTRVALMRLSYAVDLRYGVLLDVARLVHEGKPVSLANGWFNCIWQGDANEAVLRAFDLVDSPPAVWNLCRPEALSVREVAVRLGERLGKVPVFDGKESSTALLSDSSRLWARLGPAAVGVETLLDWAADWVRRGGRDLGKPTHFEVRDGQY